MPKNGQFQDLLNPQTKGAYDPADIRVYYVNGDQEEPAYRGNPGYPQFWEVGKDSTSGNYFLSVRASNHRDGKGRSTTYIDWNGTETDTVVSRFQGSGRDALKRYGTMESLLGWLQPENTVLTGVVLRARLITIVK